MTIYILLLILLPTIWVAFEISLVIRDNSRGKGKTTIDKVQDISISSPSLLALLPQQSSMGSRDSYSPEAEQTQFSLSELQSC